MSKTYTYTFLAKDLMSSKLSKIAGYGKKMGDDVEGANNRVERSSRRASNSVNNLTKIASRWIAAAASIQTFKGIANLGIELETTRVKYETLLGSMDAANKMIDDLDKFANTTPFDNVGLRKNAELLLNFGINGNKILPTLKMLGDVSGGNQERMNGMALAYAQMSSTGRLMGQDLLQMVNAGFNPLQIISEKTGRSIIALKKDMEKGLISTKMVEDAFITATSEGGRFHGMMDKISQKTAGKLSNMLGILKMKVAKWSESNLTPILGRIFDFGTKFINGFGVIGNAVKHLIAPLQPLWQAVSSLIGLMFGMNSETFTAESLINKLAAAINWIATPISIFINGLTTIINWLKPLAPILKWVAIGYGLLTAAQWALNIAMTANPIGLIIAGLAALVGIVTYAYDRVGWFRGGIMAIWETLKGFGSALKDYVIDRIKQMLDGISGIGKALWQFFNGEWKAAWETGKDAVKNLTGIGVGNGAKLINNLKETGKKAGTAYYKGITEAEANKVGGSFLSKIASSKTANLSTEANIKGASATPTGNVPDGLTNGIDSITGGGRRQTNISLSFDKLVENYTVHTETFEQGMDESLDTFKSMLLRVLNSINQMQTSYS